MAPKYSEDDDDLQLEDQDRGEEEAEPEDEDEKPAKKIKAKAKEVEDEEEDAPPRKKKVAAKASAEDDEDAEEKRVVSKKPKSKGKEGKSMATEKKHRSPKKAKTQPYGDDSLIGTIFNRAKEGVSVKKVKRLLEEKKTGKTPAYWVLTDIRRGHWDTAAGRWRWDVEEENGILTIHNIRLTKPKVAA